VNRFNLTFKGEILPGRHEEQVKRRFGKMFAIDDPIRLERFFSGQTIILRRNLDRKTAAEYFQKLHQLGVEAELVKVTTKDTAAAITKAPPSPRREEAERKAAEEAARRKAELAKKKRIDAQEAARLKAELTEKKRKATEEAACEQAILDEAKREAAAEVARVQAEQRRIATAKAAVEVAAQRAAAELAQRPSLKTVGAGIKTNLDVPLRTNNRGTKSSATDPRRGQSGAPNLYSLRPFRNTPEIRARAAQSHARMRVAFVVAALALAGLLILGGRFLSLPAAPLITGASAMAIDAQARLLLLAGDSLLLHDRSGVGTGTLLWESLGLATLRAPMAFDTTGELLAMGRPKITGAEVADVESLQLLRCNLTKSLCRPFAPQLESNNIAGFVINALDGTVFLADAVNGQLLKVSADGTVLARAEVSIPDHPIMRLESGLLFMNSVQGPAVSVFRYDDSAFGQQLDEILLLPPGAIEAEQSRVGDFLRTADTWWVSMYNPDTNNAGLYRFDARWNFIARAELPADTWPQQLARWGEKTLVRDVHHIPIQRFNARGAPEVPLASDLLETLVARQQRSNKLTGMVWGTSLVISVLVAVIGLCLGNLQRLRALVYQPHRERGADPVDKYVDAIRWVDPLADRRTRLRRTAISYTVIALALSLLAISQSVEPLQLIALLLALSGPAMALLLLSRNPIGHIGILQQQLLLVDHSGMYHLGGGSRIQYRGPFLLLDDVVVFAGTRLLPAFAPKQIQDMVTPLAQGGIKVDRNTVMVKLLQCRHPLAQGAVAMLVSFTAAGVLLCLHQVF